MTHVTQETETVEQAEVRLWSEYMSALARKQQAWRMYQWSWRRYVMTRKDRKYFDDDTAYKMWRLRSHQYDELTIVEQNAHRAWQRVSYPLNGLPLNDED